MNNKEIGYLLLVIVILFITVFTFSQLSLHSFFVLGNKPSEIGDAIGGMTAPVINIIAALLVYKSFVAQTKANKDQFEILQTEISNSNTDRVNANMDRNFDTLFTLINKVEDDFNNFQFRANNEKEVVFGSQALIQHNLVLIEISELANIGYLENFISNNTNLVDNIDVVLGNRISLIKKLYLISLKIKNMKLTDESKVLLVELHTIFYDNKISPFDNAFLDIEFSKFMNDKFEEIRELRNHIETLQKFIYQDIKKHMIKTN